MLDVLGSVVGVAGKVLDKFVEDKDLRTKLAHELQTQLVSLDLAQAQANVEAAKSSSVFVAGARPAILWICALGLFTNFFAMPLAEWGVAIWAPHIALPELNTSEIMGLTLSLLGLGGLRSWEKSKGIARERLK